MISILQVVVSYVLQVLYRSKCTLLIINFSWSTGVMLTFSALSTPSISSLHLSIKQGKLVLKDMYPFLSMRLLIIWREIRYISGLDVKASNPIFINLSSFLSTKYNILLGTSVKSLGSQVYLPLISLKDIYLYIAYIVCYVTIVVHIIVFHSILNI